MFHTGQRSKSRRGAAVAVSAATAALVTVMGASGLTTASANSPTEQHVVAEPFVQQDVLFLTHMIPHHRQAVTMAQLADTRASSGEVRRLAETILRTQKLEIRLMSDRLTRWGKPVPHPMHDHSHAGMAGMMSPEQMATLAAADGAEFDRMFVEMMIVHHEGALVMARKELRHGKNPWTMQLAQRMYDDQLREIELMRALLPTL